MALGTPDWLNKDFVERVLRTSESDESIRAIDLFVKPATNKGDNYTSDMLRATVEFSRQKGHQRITETKPIIVKISPQVEGIKKELISEAGLFRNEMHMMTSTLIKMNELLAPIRLGARALYIQKEEPVLIVMEDLTPLGYRMADRQAGLDLTHSLMAIQNLARFHASSVGVIEKDPKVKEYYCDGMFSEKYPVEMRAFFSEGVKALATEISNWPEIESECSEKVKKLADVVYQKGIENVAVSEDEFNVINHGDFWVNNMLFRYSDDGKPIDHIFVDFQLPLYGSPAIDLQYFLNTSPSMEVYFESKDYLLQEYHKTLTNTMKQIKCKTTPPTFEQLQKQMSKRSVLGMIATFVVLPLLLVDRSEVKDIDEMMQEQFNSPGVKGKIFRKVFTKRLPHFVKLGLLD